MSLVDISTVILSLGAIIISGFTAWATLFRRGELRLTQPTVIFFGPDGSRHSEMSPPPKIYLRTLLFSTGKRGLMIESMHVKLTRNETTQNFNIWAYGGQKLERGSGLFIGESGIATNHHFLTPKDGTDFAFISGGYQISLFAKILNSNTEKCIWSQYLTIDAINADLLKKQDAGIYFDWGPDSKRYMAHVETKPPSPRPEDFFSLILPSSKMTE